MNSVKAYFLAVLLLIAAFPSFSIDSTLVKRSKKILVLPAIVKSIETGWAFGAAGSYFFKFKNHKNDTLLRTSNIEALGLYTLHHQELAVLGTNIYFPRERYILRWRNTFSHFPDRFWGYGDYTPNSNLEKYTFTQLFINPQLIRKVYKSFFLGLSYEFQNVFSIQYNAGGLFDQENVVGRNGGKVSGAGIVMAWDTRNNSFNSTRGLFVQFSCISFNRLLRTDFVYTAYTLDARKFIKIGKKDVLAFQSFSLLNSGNPAYRNMATLGGTDIMRGYYAGRYRDRNSSACQVEYRKHVWKRFGVVAFAGLGKVAHKITDFNFQGLKYSLGGGLRFALNRKERINLRVDYGFGLQSSGLYFTVTEAF